MKKDVNLHRELKKTKEKLDNAMSQKDALHKAIWDMLNYANMFVLILDRNMIVRLANWSLATTLGFEDESEILGRCWLDFIKPEEQDLLRDIHCIASTQPYEKAKEYREIITNLVINDGVIAVKWFNTRINSNYNMTLSFGLKKDNRPSDAEITEDSIRSYYRDVVDKDRTMIKALRDSIIEGLIYPPVCDSDLE